MEQTLQQLQSLLVTAGGKLLLALAVFIIGRILIKSILTSAGKLDIMKKMDPTVRSFMQSFIRILLYVILLVSIVSILGVPMTSVVALMASAGVAVAMALQGSLSNLAGGIMLMIFRPFNVGEFISASGAAGTVSQITLFYTVLITPDGRKITIPNGTLMNANVENFSSEKVRRVDLKFTCDRHEDFNRVQEIISGVLAGNEKILKDPAPFVSLSGATNEALEFDVRPYCLGADYWDVYYSVTREVSDALSRAGISTPKARYVQEK
jgi:small conductance mechanosensitive channel